MTLALHRPWQAQTLLDTPLGPLRLAATAAGLAGAWFEHQRHHPGPLAAPDDASHPWLRQAAAELHRYWASRSHGPAFVFDVPLDAAGTVFQQAVWRALQAIPAGQLSTYGTLARQLGNPQAVRAVGAAVGRNPVSIFIPCHRVLGASGGLTGYAGGLDRKQALLRLEGALQAEERAAA